MAFCYNTLYKPNLNIKVGGFVFISLKYKLNIFHSITHFILTKPTIFGEFAVEWVHILGCRTGRCFTSIEDIGWLGSTVVNCHGKASTKTHALHIDHPITEECCHSRIHCWTILCQDVSIFYIREYKKLNTSNSYDVWTGTVAQSYKYVGGFIT